MTVAHIWLRVGVWGWGNDGGGEGGLEGWWGEALIEVLNRTGIDTIRNWNGIVGNPHFGGYSR